MGKWWLVGLVLVAGSVLACSVLLWRPRPVRFTKDMAERIHEGMTEAEVVAVLGRPAGNYASAPVSPAEGDSYGSGPTWFNQGGVVAIREDGGADKQWVSDTGFLSISFGPEGRVLRVKWVKVTVVGGDYYRDIARWLVLRLNRR